MKGKAACGILRKNKRSSWKPEGSVRLRGRGSPKQVKCWHLTELGGVFLLPTCELQGTFMNSTEKRVVQSRELSVTD